VVNALISINEVALRRPRVLLRRVTVCGPMNHLGMQPTTWVNSAFHPSGVGKSRTGLRGLRRGTFTCVGWRVKPISQLRFDHDTTTIRRCHDTFDYVGTMIEITVCVRFDCDTTTTRLRRKIDMLIFCKRRVEAGARDTS